MSAVLVELIGLGGGPAGFRLHYDSWYETVDGDLEVGDIDSVPGIVTYAAGQWRTARLLNDVEPGETVEIPWEVFSGPTYVSPS